MTKPKNINKKERASSLNGPSLSDSSFRKALTTNGSSSTSTASTPSSPSAVGRQIREMASDGNCLFRALSDQLHGDWGEGHAIVRQEICDYLEKHPQDFALFLILDDEDDDSDRYGHDSDRRRRKSKSHKDEDKDVCEVKDYVRKMRQDGTWGQQVELVCAARLYRRKITVFSPSGAYSIDHIAQDSHRTDSDPHHHRKDRSSYHSTQKQAYPAKKQPDILLSYHENNHYNSIRLADTPDDPQGIEDHYDTDTSKEMHPSSSSTATRNKHSLVHQENAVEIILSTSPMKKSLIPHTLTKDIITPTLTIHRPTKPLTRNSSCPCGSGLRYKKCCFEKKKQKIKSKHTYESMPEEKCITRETRPPLEVLDGGFRVFHI